MSAVRPKTVKAPIDRLPRREAAASPAPSRSQRAWLERGLNQPGGKLPLFDRAGQEINPRTIKSCIAQGWAEPWFRNPLKPEWLVCKLTVAGRAALNAQTAKN
jgi:hypothetical protein